MSGGQDLRVLAIGDIVGNPGKEMVKSLLGNIRRRLEVDLCIANGENAAAGKGITYSIARELFESGVDVITMGNHTWNKTDIFKLFANGANIIRPLNYPPKTPGSGYIILTINEKKVAVANLLGRIYLDSLDCPFRAIEKELRHISEITNIIIVDFHAEATSEKKAMGWFLDGKVSTVFGTHTHIQTADEMILPQGTAYITDIGMTGPHESVLGIKKEIIINRFIKFMPEKFIVADGPAQLNGVIIDINEATGKAESINRLIIK
jgi:metallophosphoesterase (TIGR00282 family)